MSPTLWTNRTTGHALEVIVAHGCRRFEGALDIVFMHDVSLLSAVSPHACEAVGLQFQINRKRILFALVLLRQPPHPLFDAEQFLHVMPKLMRDHIGLRKVAGVATELLE